MKKLLLTAALITTFTAPITLQSANALVVSDPGQYARMANEIKVFKEQLKVMTDALDKAKTTAEAVTGNGGFGKAALGDLARVKATIEGITNPIHNIPTILDTDDLDMSKIEDVQKTLDAVFKGEDGLMNDAKTSKEKEEIRQRASKSAIEQSTVAMENMGDSVQRTAELAEELDRTENVKESQDLTNRLLIELLSVQQQQLIILASLSRAEQLAAYEGVSSDNEEYTDQAKNRNFGKTLKDQRAKSKSTLDRMRKNGTTMSDSAKGRWGL